MAKLTKKAKLIAEKLEAGKSYSITDAVALIAEFSTQNLKNQLTSVLILALMLVNLIKLLGVQLLYLTEQAKMFE